MANDTIIAPSTPPGIGGLSVLRLSGPIAFESVSSVSKRPLEHFPSREATLSRIFDNSGALIDTCIVTFFPEPASYTAEDVVEVSCHGNPIIVSSILSVFLEIGLRLAEPGEFTKRAFLNGKLDLVQAESVAQLISSKSVRASELINRAFSGDLSSRLTSLRNDIISLLSSCEHGLDISEEDFNEDFNINSLLTINNISSNCKLFLEGFDENRFYISGARVVISGKPNVGKSTLFNALIGTERAITSEHPGTTRDYIETELTIKGVPVQLFDTAGLRDSRDAVEQEGVRRALSVKKNCDLLLEVHDVVDNIAPTKHTIHIINKSDLHNTKHIKKVKDGFFYLSAKNGEGIGALKTAIYTALTGGASRNVDVALITKRQADSLSRCYRHSLNAASFLKESSPEYELVSFELREAIKQIDVILGATCADDIITKIFDDFCVGK